MSILWQTAESECHASAVFRYVLCVKNGAQMWAALACIKIGSTLKRQELKDSPAGMVGVVGIADSIEVELLEQADVLDHALLCQSFAAPFIVLVPAHALDQDGLPIVQQLSTLDQCLPESHLHNHHVSQDVGLLTHAISIAKAMRWASRSASA